MKAEFEEFFLAEYPAVLRTVRSMTGSHAAAEEVCQEAFYRTFVHWRRVAGYDKPGAFVRRVAIRLAAKLAARQRRDATHASERGREADDRTVVHHAIRSLPRMQAAAVVLHYLEDRPVAEIADLLTCSPGTIKTHLHRARQRLAQILGEEEPVDASR